MPRPARAPADACTASVLIRMTPTQKTKLDLLGRGTPGGVAGLVRSWIDAAPLPGERPRAPAPRRGRNPTPSIPPPAPSAPVQLGLGGGERFVELDPPT